MFGILRYYVLKLPECNNLLRQLEEVRFEICCENGSKHDKIPAC